MLLQVIRVAVSCPIKRFPWKNGITICKQFALSGVTPLCLIQSRNMECLNLRVELAAWTCLTCRFSWAKTRQNSRFHVLFFTNQYNIPRSISPEHHLFVKHKEKMERRKKKGKGPGKYYRKGLSLMQVMDMFPDNKVAEEFFTLARWPSGPICPHCGSDRIKTGAKHICCPYRCNGCKTRFSVKSKTVMQHTKLGFRTWVIAIYLLTTGIKGTSSMKLHRDLGIAQNSAWHLAHRIREAWHQEEYLMAGPVEADETFIGGLEKNKHRKKKLNAGRGTVGKTPVAGLRDRATNEIRVRVVGHVDTETMQDFVTSNLHGDALLFTDEASVYEGLPNHTSLKHKDSEYARDLGDDISANTNGIESFWSMLKRGIGGTYHQVSVKHLARYVREFEGRHNARNADTIDQMFRIAQGMIGRRLTYKELTS